MQHDILPETMEDNALDRVKCTKFLGVFIDENVNWNEHLSFVTNKLAKMYGILYRVCNNLTPESLTNIYYTLCYPHLAYCASILSKRYQLLRIKFLDAYFI